MDTPLPNIPPAPTPSSDRMRRRLARRWNLAALCGFAGGAVISGVISSSMSAAIGAFFCGAGLFIMFRPNRLMGQIHDDRARLARLTDRLRNFQDGDRSEPLADIIEPGDDEFAELTTRLHELAAEAVAARHRSRMLQRHLHHNIRSETRRATAALQRQAMSDPLTGLGNRRALESRLNDMATQLTSTGNIITVLALDIDHFKEVNDALGHAVGDQCLRFLADLLKSSMRRDDLAIRLGGDEFIVLINGIGAEQVRPLAARLATLFAQMPWAHRATTRPTLSIGLASRAVQTEDELTDLLRRADAALYASKKAGRDAIRAFDDARSAA